MARDGAIPFGNRFASVWSVTRTPVPAVALTLVLDCLILLLPLTTSGETYGATNPIAFNAGTPCRGLALRPAHSQAPAQ